MEFKIAESECLQKFDMKKNLNRVKNAWNENEDQIIQEIKKRTGLNISTKGIHCYIDGSNTNGFYGYNNITLGLVDENSEADIMVIAHELFHIFYWRKIRELGLSKGELGKEKKWEWSLAEVSVYLLQKELQMLWANTEINLYSDAIEVYEKVKDYWKNESFENYLIKSYKQLENDFSR